MKRKILLTVLVLALMLTAVASLTACNKTEDLVILYERDDNLKNTYSMIAVDPNATFTDTNGNALAEGTVKLNTVGADAFINWMTAASTYDLIVNYGLADYGETLFYKLDGAPQSSATIPQATAETKVVKISTTTSVNDSGLLGYLEPIFEAAYGYDIQIASAGTGAAINAAKYGNADMILVHSKSQEVAFIDAGFARTVSGFSAERIAFMYNFFVLVGPKSDPADVAKAADIKAAFAAIAAKESTFVSRGDASGTHTKELSLWDTSLGITKDVENLPTSISGWYISAGQGMGACLTMAREKQAYCLTDKATFLTFDKNTQGNSFEDLL